MADFDALLRLRDENDQAQQAILNRALAGYERNYEHYKYGSFLGFLDRRFNRGLREDTDRHRAEAVERTRTVLRANARDLVRFPGLTTFQKTELGRYGIGTPWEGNVYLEESGS